MTAILVTPETDALIITANPGRPASYPANTGVEVIGADGHNLRLNLDAFLGCVIYTGRRANGTCSAPTALLAGNLIVALAAEGHDGDQYRVDRASITAKTAEDWHSGKNGTVWVIATTPNGGAAQVDRVWVHDTGEVTIGAEARVGTDKLQVNGGLSTDRLMVSGSDFNAAGLATADPHIVGRLWVDAGQNLKVSLG